MSRNLLAALFLLWLLSCGAAGRDSHPSGMKETGKQYTGSVAPISPKAPAAVGAGAGVKASWPAQGHTGIIGYDNGAATGRRLSPDRQPGMCAKQPMAADGIVRLSEVEVYPQYLDEYIQYVTEVGETSLRTEPGVLAMYAVAEKENPCMITILETYASREAYGEHIASAHFQKYKHATLHMVKSLVLSDQTPLNPASRINNFIVNDNNQNKTDMESNTIKLAIEGGKTFTATLADNSSAKALKELLAKGDITVEMEDYGNMEKVGPIGTSLPRNDRQTTTGLGDIILYQGKYLVIYYDTNAWNFTRLGKIDHVSGSELKSALGKGNVTVTLSIIQ